MTREHRGRSAVWLRRLLGIGFIAVGLIGLLLPLIPGIPLLLVGWLLLGRSAQRPARSGESHRRNFGAQLQLRFWLLCRWLVRRFDRDTTTPRR